MHKNLKLTVVGGIIIIVGIAVFTAGINVLEGEVNDSGITNISSNLDPGQSTNGIIPVKENILEVHIAANAEPNNVPVLIEITSKDGSFSWQKEFLGDIDEKIQVTGENTLLDYSITNNGKSNIVLYASIVRGDILQNEVVIYGIVVLTGGIITIIGIVVAIIGGILYLKSRKNS